MVIVVMGSYLIKDVLQLVLCQSRTFNIFHCTQLLSHPVTILLADRLHFLASKLLAHTRILAQIGLGTNNQAGDTGAVMMDFREPLFANVLKGGWRRDGEADQENVGLGVGQRAETIVIFLTGRIEETKGVRFITNPRKEE